MPGGPRHAPRSSQPRSSQQGPRPVVTGGSLDERRIADVIRPVVAAVGVDLESVRVSAAGRRRVLRVVVDSDQGVSLDDAATISRQLSAALDTVAVMGDFPYTLEVSSPGVDRPLTEPRHWRRAVGRLVQVTVTDAGDSGFSGISGFTGGSGSISGRIVAADPDGVILDVGGTRRRFRYPALGAGAIQVEFGPPQSELGATRDGH
jgi:ribosome maturation factor RimP